MATQGRRRAYGQHYLHDRGIIDSIAESWQKEFEREPVDELLEIGPGEGALTEALLKWVEEDSARPALTIGERDPRLIEKWQPRIEALDRVRIVPGDYADIDGRVFLPPDLQAQLGVISNLPYSAGTRIFLNLVDHRAQIPWMVLMFQQEVAMRLRAGSGEKGRGSLSVWTQTYYDVQKERLVPPGAFKPPP
jgi:16S rRNA (adenine1518-N6/adenine1519-N6)-dimethyltransferase